MLLQMENDITLTQTLTDAVVMSGATGCDKVVAGATDFTSEFSSAESSRRKMLSVTVNMLDLSSYKTIIHLADALILRGGFAHNTYT